MSRQMPSEKRYTDAPADIGAEIKASVPLEDDFPSPEELKRELKRSITIRLDPDVYAWFQLPGPGYQTRINAVLRQYMKLYQRASKPSKQVVVLAPHSNFIDPKGTRKSSAPQAAARKKKGFLERVKKARLSKAKKARAVRA